MDANGVLQNAYDPVYQALRVTSPVAGLYAPTAGSYITTSAESNLSNEKVLGTDISMRGLAADKPAASIAGRIYVETDGSQIVYYDTGSAWFEIARYTGATVPLPTVVTKTAAFVIPSDGSYHVVLSDATAATFAVTLPAASSGRLATVKKIDATVNAVTATPPSGTIDGAATVTIDTQYESHDFVSDGANWYEV